MEAPEVSALMQTIEERFLFGVDGVTEIWLVRHGDCYFEMSEALDPPLSSRGRAQAERLGARARSAGVSAVYSSPSLRARQTAIALGLELAGVDERLLEMENNPGEAAKVVMGGGAQRFSEEPQAVMARMAAAIDEIARRHPGERVAVVSHGVSILAYCCMLLRLEFGALRLFPYYTSVTTIHALGHRRRVAALCDHSHVLDLAMPSLAPGRAPST